LSIQMHAELLTPTRVTQHQPPDHAAEPREVDDQADVDRLRVIRGGDAEGEEGDDTNDRLGHDEVRDQPDEDRLPDAPTDRGQALGASRACGRIARRWRRKRGRRLRKLSPGRAGRWRRAHRAGAGSGTTTWSPSRRTSAPSLTSFPSRSS